MRATLLKDYGIEIAGGFGPLAGKVFRIGLMGPLATEESVDEFVECFAKALKSAGYKVLRLLCPSATQARRAGLS